MLEDKLGRMKGRIQSRNSISLFYINQLPIMSLSLSQTLGLALSSRNKVKVGHCLLLVTEDDS